MILDTDKPDIDSQLIVTLAKQALNNVTCFEKFDLHGISSPGFREEFCTVRIGLPRQSGHSTAALQLMYEYPDSLLFLHSGNARAYARQMLSKYTDDTDVQQRIEANMIVAGAGIPLHEIRPVNDRPFIILDQVSLMKLAWVAAIKGSITSKIILELH